jgi:hypothetical protein
MAFMIRTVDIHAIPASGEEVVDSQAVRTRFCGEMTSVPGWVTNG